MNLDMKVIVENINIVIAFLTTVVLLCKCIYDFYYCYKCENFYRIPSKYFESNITMILIKTLFLLFLFLAMKYSLFDSKSMWGIVGTLIAKCTIVCSSIIVILYMHFNCYTKLSIFIKKNLGSIFKGTLIYTLVYCLSQLCHCICLEKPIIIIYVIFFAATALNLFFVGLKNKSVYEVVNYNGVEYLVLSDKNNIKLCVKYSINNSENSVCLELYVKEYLLLNENVLIHQQEFNIKDKFEIKINQS